MEQSKERGKILLLNIHPFYYDVFDREKEYEKANIQIFTLETLSKEVVEDSIKKCDGMFNLYNEKFEFYWNKANDTLKNLWNLKKTNPMYKHMKIDQKYFCKDAIYFNASLQTEYFTYEYTYFRNESNFKVKTNPKEFQKFVQYDDSKQKRDTYFN